MTWQQIEDLASDPSSLSAGNGLASRGKWLAVGFTEGALWGECQGSALYQIRIDTERFGYKCNCPSRKFPCKHVLGLLMLAAKDPDSVPRLPPPEWVTVWREQRNSRSADKDPRPEESPSAKKSDLAAKAKRAQKREERVRLGLERFSLWLADLVRNGLAGLEDKPLFFWSEQAARLVDAQAPGLAGRVAKLSLIPGDNRDWPLRLLEQLGKIQLLIHAFGRQDELEPSLRADVRQLLGWTVSQEELTTSGEFVEDDWLAAGQLVEEEERLRVERTWLVGIATGRAALVLQFAPLSAEFPESVLVGTVQRAKLCFYPSAYPQRARITEQLGTGTVFRPPLLHTGTIKKLLADAAIALSRQPWLERFPALLSNVVPFAHKDVAGAGRFALCDQEGNAVPLTSGEHWTLLAIAGGRPLDLFGEWDGRELRPLSIVAGDKLRTLP